MKPKKLKQVKQAFHKEASTFIDFININRVHRHLSYLLLVYTQRVADEGSIPVHYRHLLDDMELLLTFLQTLNEIKKKGKVKRLIGVEGS